MLRALVAIFGISCVLSLIVNWGARSVARRLGLVDKPDGHRKLQSDAIPLAGGIAIFAVIVAIIGGLMAASPDWRFTVLNHGTLGVGLLLAGGIIILLGVADDARGLRGRQKLAGQIIAAGILVASGLSIEKVQLLGMQIDLGLFAIPLTMFWLVGAINSLNLLDGIDGLAGTIGLVLSSALAVMAFMNGHHSIALVATIMAGSLVGFLRFNLPPATMYLGDAGSMLIGLAVGVMAIRASLKGPGTVMLAVPLALWTIPIFDTAAAILRRKLTGRSIYETDRAHLHHHLVQRIGHRMTLVCVGAVSLLTSAAALFSIWSRFDFVAILCSALVVLLFVSLRVFGYSELLLALVRARSFARSLLLPVRRPAEPGWNDAVRLQGTREWELIWDTLTESAAKFDLVHLRLDVNVPVLGEGYNASWSRPNGSEQNRHWRFDTPLVVEGRVLGRLNVVGCGAGAAGQRLERLTELVGEVESHLVRLVKPATAVHAARNAIAAQPPSESDTVVEMDVVPAPQPARRSNGAGPWSAHGRN
jgi:UDP-GlcNAc:undecaprenyl-phosphate GlcNAc-1-phosphate transferase